MKIKKMKNKFQEYKENKCSKKNLDSKQQTVSKRIIFGQQLEVCLSGGKKMSWPVNARNRRMRRFKRRLVHCWKIRALEA